MPAAWPGVDQDRGAMRFTKAKPGARIACC